MMMIVHTKHSEVCAASFTIDWRCILFLVTVLFSFIPSANNPSQSVALQPYTEVQPQAATISATVGPIAPHTNVQFSWVHTLLGAGLFLGLGASAAITLKVHLLILWRSKLLFENYVRCWTYFHEYFSQKLFIPSLKSWTRRVVAEGDENANDELASKLCEEIREAIKVSTSAFSDTARTNQEVLASKDEGFRICFW